MTTYTLLAHKLDGTQALVQHDTEQAAYLYTFDDVRTHQRVDPSFTVSRDEWETEYSRDNRFPNVDHVMLVAQGKL